MTVITLIARAGEKPRKSFLNTVFGYIPNPKLHIIFTASKFREERTTKKDTSSEPSRATGEESILDLLASWFQNKESSFIGHTVNALVLTGDEGRAKLR